MSTWSLRPPVAMAYDIHVTPDIADPVTSPLTEVGAVPGRRLLVVDSGVPDDRVDAVAGLFAARGVTATVARVPGGEAAKDFPTLLELLDRFRAFDLDRRREPVIAIGGGALLDVAGFAAGMYRRGVPIVKVPTTLLSYVDASIGIKTGVNFGGRKNLVGSFTAPAQVILDKSFFVSLPGRELRSGLGEILKLAVGCDEVVFKALEGLHPDQVYAGKMQSGADELLRLAPEAMIRQLEPNIHEDELCRPADLGHTFSQPFEMRADEPLLHGEAVTLDVLLSCRLAHGRGLLGTDELARIEALADRLRLRAEPPDVGVDLLWRSVRERTAHRGGRQRIPLPNGVGTCVFVDDLKIDELAAAYAPFRA